jgi:hypothetical protein
MGRQELDNEEKAYVIGFCWGILCGMLIILATTNQTIYTTSRPIYTTHTIHTIHTD